MQALKNSEQINAMQTIPDRHTESETALLLFTRTAEDEARNKSLSGRQINKLDKKISEILIAHAKRIAQKSGMPFFTIDSDHQVGKTFGERLTNAYNDLFALGYTKVISIGNDCLSLTVSDLSDAEEAMHHNSAAIGRSSSGGAYLIGIDSELFEKAAFENLNWNTPQLFDSLIQYLTLRGKGVCLLRGQRDVNTTLDLKRELKSIPQIFSLRLRIISLLNSFFKLCTFLEDAFTDIVKSYSISRAPPTYL